jgi:uncharacterized SAM-binding protein YcdF (DUF218 family)
LWLAGAVVAIVALLVLARGPLLRGVGGYLIVEEPLRPADGLLVLGGGLPFRAQEAAALYHAGWAPTVLLVPAARRESDAVLRELGVQRPAEWELSREVLERLGVPAGAIRIVEGEAPDTREELQLALAAMRAASTAPSEDGSSTQVAPDGRVTAIFVTSPTHSRRVLLTWQRVAGDAHPAVVRVARNDPFDVERWWEQRRFVFDVVREYLALVNLWLGYPVGTGFATP